MYSRKRGKSGSTKPLKKGAPWVKEKPADMEKTVVELAKKGNSSAKIGTILRDQHGIPSVRLSKLRVSEIMKKNDAYPKMPEDLFNLLKKAVDLRTHMDKNKKDYTSKRGLEITESKIRRLAKYYKRDGTIANDWKYDPDKARLLVK
jgi:small subunit ribosomal protein S15